jgi:two-component system phosphate regulon sensor histidine kinase PhoR
METNMRETPKPLDAASYVPRILVIDDEKRIRDACRDLLTQQGYRVACAENGMQGLEMIQAAHFDIILLDLMMPNMSGFEVLEQVKIRHPDTVVIVITGYATLEHSIETMKKGAFDFIPKPFFPDQLRVIVAKAINHTRALRDIATEKSRIRVLIDRLSDGVMAADHQKIVVLSNPVFKKLVSYTGGQARGKRVDEVIGNVAIEAMIDEALAMGPEQFVELTQEIVMGQGPDAPVLAACCFPFRDRVGVNLGAITVLHDITALKRAEQMKAEFVSMVVHEIRSPMSSVKMLLNVILDGLAGEVTEKQRDILSRASEKIESLGHLASELLDLSKIESGLVAQERERLDLCEIIEAQVEFHRAKAAAKSMPIFWNPPVGLPSVVANRQNMEEVFSNLIVNAIKYTPDGGSVTLSAEKLQGEICVRVSDTGLGIGEADQENIFNRFYRVKDPRTRFITGTGLGLPIVKRIVEAHHGRIEVKSTIDTGSTFSVYLPVTDFPGQ